MNFLFTLAARSLSSLPVAEPPRVPFVSSFPDGPLLAPEPDASMPASAPPSRAEARRAARDVVPVRPPPIAPPAPPAPHVSPSVQTVESPRPVNEAPRAEPGPRPPPHPLERVVERRVSSPSVEVHERSAPVMPRPPAVMTGDAPEAPSVHERIERHHTLERIIERLREADTALPEARSVATPARVAAPPRPAPPVPFEPARRAAQPERPEQTAPVAPGAPLPPAPQPQVQVSIGKLIVRVQTPPRAASSEPVRPATPGLSLEAYTAARRRGGST
ncbi:hypothetical protein MYSTI_06893 [Myxococcus stipitatus DSM 14675]|uniref:Uncharacterized protein n=1 Tax=Myxococcus stipitatus (strain DSM 14675 / JCM 12634 / Mx s8) TaxID=1278073 RepID=L7UGR7_MYXSD|nr:hypothetical protein [Myxococcus stipitatus]AGC48166.1 hypothetical protein MYSTI_06893 [Myxococcus stipitatus DSM 14675]